MRFDEHKAETGIPYRWFAKKLGIDDRRLSQYATGKTTIPLDIALRIEDLTEGKVTVRDWGRGEGTPVGTVIDQLASDGIPAPKFTEITN